MNILISLTVLGTLAMFGRIFKWHSLLMPITLAGLTVALYFDVTSWNSNHTFFNSMSMDNFALAFTAVCMVSAIFTLVFYHQFYLDEDVHHAEVYALILFSLAGVVVLVSYTNLLMLFLGIEILSLCLYILAGLRKRDLLSNEASLKYFLMGAFSTGFLLFGIAMLYGATGSFDVSGIADYLTLHSGTAEPFIVAGIILIMIGLLFKIAAAPFHFWTPDVYQGAPTLVTGYMATVGKIAAFAAFLRLFQLGFSPAKETYQLLIASVAVITMFAGNIIAIYQNSVKRMLAYSSIAHAGYMLIALLTANNMANSAVLFYAVAYTLASLAAFVTVLIVQNSKGNESVSAFNGLSKSNPLIAFVFAVAMFSLAGIPPAAGFFAKFYIFSSAIKDGWTWLVALAVINSFISVYYYFRPVISAYMRRGDDAQVTVGFGIQSLLLLLSILTLLAGLLPGFLTAII